MTGVRFPWFLLLSIGLGLPACGSSTAAAPTASAADPTSNGPDPVRQAYLHEAARREADGVWLNPQLYLIWPADDEVAAYVQAHEAELRATYEEVIHRFRDREAQIRARHILVRVGRDDGDERRAEARARAEALRQRIVQGGESFAAVAREASADPGSAARGGDLGWFPRGRMVPAFEDAAWTLPEGEVSEPVETHFGFHLIVRVGRREGDIPFEEAAPDLAADALAPQLALARVRTDADMIAEAVRAGEALEEVAARLVDVDPKPRVRPWSGSRWQLPIRSLALRSAAQRAFELSEDGVVMVEAEDGIAVFDVRVPPVVPADPPPEVRACLEERMGQAECAAAGAIGQPPCDFCVEGVEPSELTAPANLSPELLEQLRHQLQEQERESQSN